MKPMRLFKIFIEYIDNNHIIFAYINSIVVVNNFDVAKEVDEVREACGSVIFDTGY